MLVWTSRLACTRRALMASGMALLGGCGLRWREPLRMGLVVWPGYQLAFLARARGAFTDDQIRLLEYGSVDDMVRAFQNGSIDVCTVTLDYVLQMNEADAHIVLVIDRSVGGDAIIGRPEFPTMASLAGHRVGLARSVQSAYVFYRACDLQAVPPETITLIPVEIDRQVEAFQDGTVDAVVAFEPVCMQLLEAGGRSVFDSKMIPGEIIDVLLVRRQGLAENGRAVRRFLAGWFEAFDAFHRDPQQAAPLLSQRAGLSPEAYLATLAKLERIDLAANRRLLQGQSPRLAKTLQEHQQRMLRYGLLPAGTRPPYPMTAAFLPPSPAEGLP